MEKTIPKMETRSVLAMSYILEDYKRFGNAILEAQNKTRNRDFSYDLLRVSQGKTVLGASVAKRVYNEYKEVIDKINEYGYVSNFIMCNYCWGKNYDDIAEYFYQYLIANKGQIEVIRQVLAKLVELRFDSIELDTGLNFNDTVHKVDTSRYHNITLPYTANMVRIPDYQSGVIKFKSTSTPYEMELSTTLGKISEYGRKIKLNTLVFDPSILPTEITPDNLFEEIKGLQQTKKSETTAIRNSVDLSISIEDLQYMIESTMRTIDTIEDETIKLNLLKSATTMLEELGKMKIERDALESQIIQKHPELTEEKLTLEKKLYKQRREWASIDLC